MALDLSSPLKVVSWASAHADCPMRYTITGTSDMVIIFGSGSNEFELSFEVGALQTLAQLTAEALADMTAKAEHSDDAPLVLTGERLA
jgi:hypothetical protein